jgi:hypothetical protein
LTARKVSHMHGIEPVKTARGVAIRQPSASKPHRANNVGAGFALGVGLGVAFAMAFGASDAGSARRKKVAADKPLPHPLGLFERDEPR